MKEKHAKIEDMPKVYKVSLQFPEGLLLHATLIADIVSTYCEEPSKAE